MKLKTLVQGLVAAGLITPALAQETQRIEITGSSIKRVQAEGALPIQVITRKDIDSAGITSAEQLVATLTSNGNGIDNMATNQGGDFLNSTFYSGKAANNGAAGASLRGFGAANTLVLLNGRRISSHGLNGKSVDLNSVPMAAVDRIEILKDGASAIYGTDAIGGVINFILRKDFRGLEVAAAIDTPLQAGGEIRRLSAVFGAGELAKDRYNFMVSLTYDENDRLRGSQRSFHNGYDPDRALAPDTTGTPFANIAPAAGTALASAFQLPGFPTVASGYNRVNLLALTGDCDIIPDQYIYRGDVTGFPRSNAACVYDYGRAWSMMQPVQRTNLVSRGSFALARDHTATLEFLASRTESSVEYTPVQLTTAPYRYPVSGPYYQNLAVLAPQYFKPTNTDPTDTRVFFDATRPLQIRWRCMACGPRQQDTKTDTYRLFAGLEGVLAGWDYKAGLSTAQSEATTKYGNGNMIVPLLQTAMQSGLVNPFLLPGQQQTAAGQALIDAAQAKGLSLYGGKAKVMQADATVSREIAKLPAGPLAMALGVDYRNEEFQFNDNTAGNPAITGAGSPAGQDKADRRITALFTEFQVPIVKDLEAQFAVRHDRYSDFGSTTNPKVALRWQPSKNLVLRGSFGKGFRAPDFGVLYGGDVEGQFNSDVDDPATCNATRTDGCGIRPSITVRSNPDLKPEVSKQWSVGAAFSPTDWLSGTIDLWDVRISDRISPRSPRYILDNEAQFPGKVVRDEDGVAETVIMDYFNLATDKARGVDMVLNTLHRFGGGRLDTKFEATYFDSYKTQLFPGAPTSERVGQFGDQEYGWDLKLRWKHTFSVTWAEGPWSMTVWQNYWSGYNAEVNGFGSGVTPANYPKKIDSYTLYNASVTYSGIKNLTVTAGLKNIFNTRWGSPRTGSHSPTEPQVLLTPGVVPPSRGPS
jgi:iron complex outermembrane recepter protein